MLSDLPDELYARLAALRASDAPAQTASGYALPIVRQIAQLCIDAFADFCAVYLRNSGNLPAAVAARTPQLHDALAGLPYDAEFEAFALERGISSVLQEPLVANDRTIGVLVLGMSDSEFLSSVDRRVISILSSIVSTAVEQAQALQHHYRVSKRLQQALLPAQLPSIPGATFDAAYRPASDEADVGGDWYDAFDLGDGRIGISVGDVTGHGLEAAVAMSEIRRAIRAAAPSNTSPQALLNYIDGVIASESIGMATAIVGYYDPDDGTFTYACAGHPLPVLLSSSGRPMYLPGGGLLLGLGMNPASQDWIVTLTPGMTCFLYTDGLLEYRRDIVAGERELLVAMERIAKNGVPTADALHHAIFNGSIANTDDCATLSIHQTEPAQLTGITLKYSAFPLSAAFAREALRAFFKRFGFSKQLQFEMLAAAGEAVANAIEHGAHGAAGTYTLRAEVDDDTVSISVENPGHWRPFTPRDERGRGVPIMRACARSLEISSTSDHTRVTVTFSR